MKIQTHSPRNSGSVLIMCLGLTTIIAITLVTYLLMVQGECNASSRSQAWNNSMAESEAGTEEGMALINKYVGTGTPLGNWTTTAVSDGWSQSGNVFSLTRTFGSGNYLVSITNASSGNMWMKSTGTIRLTNGSVTALSRAVLISFSGASAFQGAILAKQGITLTGGAMVDSFNSQNPLYSSNGLYTPSLHEAHGNMMTDASNVVITTEVTMSGNGQVYGKVTFGPDDTASLSGNATIGDTNFAGPGIESGWTNSTANISIPNAPPLPNVSWLPMPIESNNVYVFSGLGPGTTNYYQIPSSFGNLSGQNTILITNGTVAVDAEGNFQMSGQSGIYLAPGANLILWLNGNSPQISGQGLINLAGNATNVTVYGTTNCTSLKYSGNAEFIGTIYAPQADIDWSGNADVVGSAVANSFKDSGGANLHYDESLHSQTSGAFVINSWAEVPP